MKVLFHIVQKHLNSQGAKYVTDPAKQSFEISVQLPNAKGGVLCLFDVQENADAVLVHGIVPIAAPSRLSEDVCELVCRINATLVDCRFIYVIEDGHLFCRASRCFRGITPEVGSIKILQEEVLAALNGWMPAFHLVLDESKPARDAFDAARRLMTPLSDAALDEMLKDDEDEGDQNRVA